jgi:hypothetical protein
MTVSGRLLHGPYDDAGASLSNSYASLSTFVVRHNPTVKEAAMDKAERPSVERANSLFRIGKNSRGQWVVQDQTGLCGGLFVSRAEAVKFAMFENGNRPQAVIMVPGILELELSGKPRAGGALSTQVSLARAA